ncbi:MAG: hypothetical protein R3F34_17835 [Planctomycetota bacterium]
MDDDRDRDVSLDAARSEQGELEAVRSRNGARHDLGARLERDDELRDGRRTDALGEVVEASLGVDGAPPVRVANEQSPRGVTTTREDRGGGEERGDQHRRMLRRRPRARGRRPMSRSSALARPRADAAPIARTDAVRRRANGDISRSATAFVSAVPDRRDSQSRTSRSSPIARTDAVRRRADSDISRSATAFVSAVPNRCDSQSRTSRSSPIARTDAVRRRANGDIS